MSKNSLEKKVSEFLLGVNSRNKSIRVKTDQYFVDEGKVLGQTLFVLFTENDKDNKRKFSSLFLFKEDRSFCVYQEAYEGSGRSFPQKLLKRIQSATQLGGIYKITCRTGGNTEHVVNYKETRGVKKK